MSRSLILKNQEQHYTLSELARMLPVRRCGKTLYRWCRYGLRGVKMEHIAGTSGMHSSIEAYMRFIDRINET